MAGDTIEQYRAAIGLFYSCVRCVKKCFYLNLFQLRVLFKCLLQNLLWFGNLYKTMLKCFAQHSLVINYFFQVMFMLLFLSGDIETNPGPCTGTQYTLDIFHLNIRSIRNKLDGLLSLVSDFDVLCFTESHLNSSILDRDLFIDGFNTIFRKDRNSFGGGIIVYISNSLRVKRRIDLEPINIECIWIEISDPTCNILLCCTYRPPNCDNFFWRNLSWSIEKAYDESDKIIVVGDLNVDFLNIPHTHLVKDLPPNRQESHKTRAHSSTQF